MRYFFVAVSLSASSVAWAQVAPDSWSTPGQLTPTPGMVALDGDFAYPGSGDHLYMTTITGEHNEVFFRYSLVTNAWEQMATHPSPDAFHLGTALESAGGDRLFCFIGEFDTFWGYSVSGNTWTLLGNAPAAMFGGADLVYPRAGDFMFALSGGTDFWRYQISTNTWINTIADAPAAQNNGGALVSPGGNFIYMFRGNNTTDYNRYSISGDAWTAMTATPANVSNGGDLVFPGSGDFIFALRGDTTTDFWRYTISTDTWTVMAPVPAACFSGSTLVYPGTGSLIYAIQGAVGAVYRYRFKANEAPTAASVVLIDQRETDAVTPIAVGGITPATEIAFVARLNEPERDRWNLQVEVRETTAAFTGVPTLTSAQTLSGQTVDVLTAPLATGNYHWRYRFVDELGATGAWTSFGGNADGQTDFTVGIVGIDPGRRSNRSVFQKCFSLSAAGPAAPAASVMAVLLAAWLSRRRR